MRFSQIGTELSGSQDYGYICWACGCACACVCLCVCCGIAGKYRRRGEAGTGTIWGLTQISPADLSCTSCVTSPFCYSVCAPAQLLLPWNDVIIWKSDRTRWQRNCIRTCYFCLSTDSPLISIMPMTPAPIKYLHQRLFQVLFPVVSSHFASVK